MRSYFVNKGGKRKKVLVQTDRIKRPVEHEPIGEERVIGVDTESLNSKDGLVTVLTPFADAEGVHCQETFLRPDQGDPILVVVDYLFNKFSEPAADPRPGKGRAARSRVRYRMKHGTIITLAPVVLVFYHMEYDLQRLFLPDSPFYQAIALGAVKDVIISCGPYEIQMVSTNPTGSAPSFHWIVFHPETERALRLYGIDMWGYWKSGLDRTAKSLEIGSKVKIEKDWFSTPLEDYTDDMIREMIEYAGEDARLTREVYLATARLLGGLSKAVFTKTGILPPSAPGAAARLAFSMMSEPEIKRPPKAYEQLALDAYHGGYVACRVRGWVENMTVADLHSAYPSAKRLLPDPCRVEYVPIEAGTWTDIPEHIREAGNLGFVCATFKVFPDRFPVISKHGANKTLHQPGIYERFAISLPELSVMFDLGQVKMARIHHGFYLDGPRDSSFLGRFVDYFYSIKEREEREGRKDSPMYQTSKLLMNSLYGKLIEVREPAPPILPDFQNAIIYQNPHKSKAENKRDFAQALLDSGEAGVMELSNQNLEIIVEEGLDPKQYGVFIEEAIPAGPATAGNYFLPIYASLITAMTRAKIATMLNLFQAVAGDTDSMFTPLRPGTPEWEKAEKAADWVCRRAGVGPVRDDPGLGGYGIEMVNARGYMAGLKQYFLVSRDPASPKKKKLAHHAIVNAGKLATMVAVARLARGRAHTYETKPKPRRLRETIKKGDRKYGVFERETRMVVPKEDERMRLVRHIPDPRHPVWEFEWKELEEVEMDEDRD